MFLAEEGLSDAIPASRFSDGTLSFLRILALIYEPAAPAILALEEPEVGLHPDAVLLRYGANRFSPTRQSNLYQLTKFSANGLQGR